MTARKRKWREPLILGLPLCELKTSFKHKIILIVIIIIIIVILLIVILLIIIAIILLINSDA